MFVPDRNACVVDFVLCCCELALAVEIDLNDWINSLLSSNLDVFGLLDVDVYHIIASLHLAHSLLIVALRNVCWFVVRVLVFHFFLFLLFFRGWWGLACNDRLATLVLFSKRIQTTHKILL